MENDFIAFLLLLILYDFRSDEEEITDKIGGIGEVEKNNAIIL